MSDNMENRADKMAYYTVRFPIEWETRIAELQKVMDSEKPADVLSVSTASVIRQAFKIGIDTLVKKYGVSDG
jgi:hypothetical protein